MENRIKTIQSSLAIENNSLTIDQVTAILEGKRVLGAPNEIKEVKNAIDAYELLLELNPYKTRDLLKAHKLMMADLVRENGRFRSGGVGVFDGKKCIHLAPPAERVPALIADLFAWVKKTKVHPLVSSCVFHYEFVFRRQRTHGPHVADAAADAMESHFCMDSGGDHRQRAPARVLFCHSTE